MLLGLLLSLNFAMAQGSYSAKPILFLNETVAVNAEDVGRKVTFQKQRYVVVQGPDLKVQKDYFGFETLDYIPHEAAFARISETEFEQAKKALEAVGGRVLNLNDAWRLSKPLFTRNYSEWAWAEDDANLILWIQYYRGLSHQDIVLELALRGIQIRQEVAEDRRIEILFHPDHLLELMELGFVQYLEEHFAPGDPENYTASTNYRLSALQSAPYNGDLNYDGTGIMIAHNDAGLISDHIDFKGRFTNINNSFRNTDHGFHTAGTIFGAGNKDPYGRGMADGSDLHYDNYPRSLNRSDNLYNSINARLTSNSFSNGCNAGYSTWSQQLDKDAYDTPNLLHVFSAGNDGDINCGYGAGQFWGNITGGHKQAKNVVTVGALTTTDGLANFSSRGPATDGRVKPDVVGVGVNVFSTTDINGPNSYDSKSGTSMSCPGVTGVLAVLMHAYKDLNNGTEAHGALAKGIIMNSAEDLGNPGPDFKYGYGRVNALQAYQIIENNWYQEDSLATGDSATFTFNIPSNTAQARFMLIWADREASPAAARDLVNDLDLSVDFGGSTYLPWVLNPAPNGASLNANALRARDSLNNIEQVTIDYPSAGTTSIKVKGNNVPTGGKQRFFIIAFYEADDLSITYPLAGKAVEANATSIIRFDAARDTNYTAELSWDGGATWNFFRSTTITSDRQFSWPVPDTTASNVYLRVHSPFDTSLVGPITITPRVTAIRTVASCPDSVKLDWDDLPGVSGYVVYRLGTKYMDSVAYVDSSEAQLPHLPFDEDWYAVAGVVNQSHIGFRSDAFEKVAGVYNCFKPNDLKLVAVLSPGTGEIPSCVRGSQSDRPVLLIRNLGSTSFSNFDVKFKASTSSAVLSETVNRSLNPGDTLIYYFQNNRVSFQGTAVSNYRFWIESNDQNLYNDSVSVSFREVSNGTTVTVPYVQNFENFSNCATGPDCEAGTCTLLEGWYNYANTEIDQADFRTHNSFTNNPGTGPSFDATTGTAAGKYIFVDASGDCDSAEAMVISPCIDLRGTSQPHASIAYHMFGAHMGSLEVDVYDGEIWHLDLGPEIAGNQGASWVNLSIDLSPYVGKTINVRFRGKLGSGTRSDLALDDFSVVDSASIGLNELAWANLLQLYPNPSTGQFMLSSELPLDENTGLEISDLSGALLWKGHYKANAGNGMLIDWSHQPAGIYFLVVQREGYRKLIRMIKE